MPAGAPVAKYLGMTFAQPDNELDFAITLLNVREPRVFAQEPSLHAVKQHERHDVECDKIACPVATGHECAG